jgi:hypothetical protein
MLAVANRYVGKAAGYCYIPRTPAHQAATHDLYKTLASTLMASFLMATLRSQPDDAYDVVIVNGRVMDPESGLDAVRNVGLRAGKVAAISAQPMQGRRTVDAKGWSSHPVSSTARAWPGTEELPVPGARRRDHFARARSRHGRCRRLVCATRRQVTHQLRL